MQRTRATTMSLVAAAAMAVGGWNLIGCQSHDEHAYRSGDAEYPRRVDSYNSGSGGTGTGTPMGDSFPAQWDPKLGIHVT